jgi:rSAM/selenodomain-associated transferase 2
MRWLPEKKWHLVMRMSCVLVAAGAFLLIFRRIDLEKFIEAITHMRAGWFLGAVALYGTAFLFGAWRWHLTLRTTGCALHPSASVRGAFIGHFFYTIFFGAAGGDVGKSAVYARWYQLPLPEVLAAAPLDRMLGLAGLTLVGMLGLMAAALNGGFSVLKSIQFRLSTPLLAAAGLVGLVGLAVLVWWRPRGESAPVRMFRAFRTGAGRLALAPRTAAVGLACAFGVQLVLNVALAFNLNAVSHTPQPWSKLFWVFPVITLITTLPITVAGAGVREGASIMMLGLYGIPAEDAVAAALLSLATNLFWGAVGGLVLWREEVLFARQPHPVAPKTISLVIPALNEAGALPETIRRARAIPEISEIIVVDGGSRDRTRAVAEEQGCRVLTSAPARGGQMRAGAAQATGDVVLLLHADTWLPPEAGRVALKSLCDQTVVGGGFWKIFHDASPLLAGSRWKCAVRVYLGRRIAGDQGLFVRREVLERIGGVPDMPLMEEFELCRLLHRAGRLALADATVITSARRFAKLGVIRTYLRMWWVTTRYRLGTPPGELRRIYERE